MKEDRSLTELISHKGPWRTPLARTEAQKTEQQPPQKELSPQFDYVPGVTEAAIKAVLS